MPAASGPIKAGVGSIKRTFRPGSTSQSAQAPSGGNSGRFAALLFLGAIIFPSQVNIYLWGGTGKFTPGRLAIIFLFVPALVKLFGKTRHAIASDLVILTLAIWMIGARFPQDGLDPSAVAEAIEFCGAYAVARGYFFDQVGTRSFIQALKIVVVFLAFLSILDPLLGTNIVWHQQPPQYRLGLVRATSLFDGAEMNGTFFAASLPLFLYSERTAAGRILWAGFCIFGCALSISSGPLLSLLVVIAVYFYDMLLGEYKWRWKLLVGSITAVVIVISIFAQHPISWIISHLTFDPASSYFRIYVFDYMFGMISSSPLVGIGFGPTSIDDDFLAHVSVDCTFIVYTLRFGIPMLFLFLLAIVSSFWDLSSGSRRQESGLFVRRMGTGFTLAIASLALTGLTVHIFHTNWMFWGSLVGIRGSIKELALSQYVGMRGRLPRFETARPA